LLLKKSQNLNSILGLVVIKISLVLQKNKENDKLELKMLHFFINTGINDTAYYWNELVKCIKVYIALKKPNIGQLKYWWISINSLAFEYDYQYMIDEIINQIKILATKLK
jgi:arginine decarboxylase